MTNLQKPLHISNRSAGLFTGWLAGLLIFSFLVLAAKAGEGSYFASMQDMVQCGGLLFSFLFIFCFFLHWAGPNGLQDTARRRRGDGCIG
jgi:hypothetical protein